MDRRLFQPKWLLAHVTVLTVAAVFVALGFWQLARHGERVEQNKLGESRLGSPAVQLAELLDDSEDIASIEFRHVETTGEYAPDLEVLIRSQVHLGTAGFHVITPLVGEGGEAILINRGWVPLNMDRPPVDAAPPRGLVTVEGWVELSEQRPPLGPEDPPDGDLEILSRVDVSRISQQLPMDVAPVYVVRIAEDGEEPPIPVRQPAFDDQGPHLAYAIQWFGFAIVGLVGYSFLARRRLRSA